MERFLFVWLFAVLFMGAPFWLPWLIGQLQKALAHRRTMGTIKLWGVATFNYNHAWQAAVCFLNSGGKLIRMSLLDFLKMRMPTGEYPEWWILHLGSAPDGEYHPKDRLQLVHKGHVDDTSWSLPYYACTKEDDGQLKIYVQDRDQHTAVIAVEAKLGSDGLLTKVLEIVTNHRDVQDAWIKAVKNEGAPILLETKGTMGKSPKIRALRYALEYGPSIHFKFGESILPSYLL